MKLTTLGALAASAILPGGLAAAAPATLPGPAPAEVERMVAEISPERVIANVEKLAGFGTRHTLSDTESETRGIGAARRWIRSEFERYAREAEAAGARAASDSLRANFDAHPYKPDGRRVDVAVEIVNVVAVLPGVMPEARDRAIYITGHYDSMNSDVMNRVDDAPGANDDASGVAALMEIARVMAGREYDATIVFMATAGEEQGLLGARLHANAARDRGARVDAVLNNDIVGDPAGQYPKDSPQAREARSLIRLFSEGVPRQAPAVELARIAALGAENDGPARQLARSIREVALLHDLPVKPMLVYRNDRFLRGGDHSAFLEAGFPAAVRFTAMNEDYSRQHKDVTLRDGRPYGDLPRFVEAEYLANVARLNAAAAAHLANAPSSPADVRIVTAALMNETLLRWSPSPEPDVAGYEIVVRATTSPFWERAIDAGAATEWTGDISKDHNFFGVRAYDRDGYRSMVGFAGVAKE